MSVHPRRRSRRRRVDSSSTDLAFDDLVPEELRHLSENQWTPIDVAIRVASLLSPDRHARVLDVGGGVGKMCSVGALSSQATWYGVEQHEHLVVAAERLARGLGVAARTRFVHGDAFALDWRDFDALYFYNPFEVPVFADGATIETHTLHYRAQTARAVERLATLRPRTRVVTYHGFGGVMPASFELVHQERVPLGADLVLWIQGSADRRPARSS